MKKSMKKYLVLMFVVMIAMIVTAFSVSAAENNNHCSKCETYVPVLVGKSVAASCQQYGYSEMICKPCKDKGIYTLLYREKTSDALGHLENVNHVLVEEENGTSYYKKVTTCGRIANDTKCDYNFTAEYDDHTVIKYYKVTYVNSFVADTFDESCRYADLAKTYKEEVLYTEFVKEGTRASYSTNPYRMADKNWGEYVFVGWALEAQPADDADNSKLPHYSNGFDVPIEDVLIADYKLYAVFEGITVVHNVTFYSERGEKLQTLTMPHGGIVQKAQIPTAPLKADVVEYKYSFDFWTLFDYIADFQFAQEPVYGNLHIKAHYKPTLKRYLLKYFNKDGTELGEGMSEYVTVKVLGDDSVELPHKAMDISRNPDAYGVANTYFDESYEYTFTGNWIIEGRDNYVLNINNIKFPAGTLDYEQTHSYIKVTPEYRKVVRVYDLTVFVTYDNDGNYHPEEVNLQVTDANGKPIGVATLTEKDIVSAKDAKVPTYKKVFKVNYSPSYRVVATSKNYKGEKTPGFNYGGDNYNNYYPGGATITLYREKEGPCSCICHTVFKPVWVGVLNLLYNLFKVKYVCCDDMFANIGENLAYGPNTK